MDIRVGMEVRFRYPIKGYVSGRILRNDGVNWIVQLPTGEEKSIFRDEILTDGWWWKRFSEKK
jgi:hypothetical protein